MPADYDPLLDPLTCDEHVAAKLGEDGKPQYGKIANGGAARLMLDLGGSHFSFTMRILRTPRRASNTSSVNTATPGPTEQPA